ncbi:MAG: ribonuclease protein component [Chloroflexota bacterium]|jgi:ribonuclease P protein component|nr:ribonuclease protein component [Chloroflexota bacterium]
MGGALEMLRSKRDFAALQEHSRSRSHPLLLVRYRSNGLGKDRYGISTGKRLGGAVVRNRVRRRLREAIRAMDRSGSSGWDILVVARQASVQAGYRELADALQRTIGPIGAGEGTTQA